MFTGIITHIGKIEKITGDIYTISAGPDLISKLEVGTSIAVNGVCLTVISEPQSNSFDVEIMPETIRRIAGFELDSSVNLELPLTASSLMSGHMVQGHVDTKAEVSSIVEEGESRIIHFKISPESAIYIVEKGSIAINGISLTVIEVNSDQFSVGIIPHSLKNTTMHAIKVGDKVNIELDIVAKYIHKFTNVYDKKS